MENQPIETTEQTTQTPVESAALNLMLSDEAVTSEQDNFRDIVNRASGVKDTGIDAAEAARKSQLASIEGTFGREQRNLERNARDARTAFAQGSSMGTSTAQFKLLNDTINQNLGDIKARKEEARLNSDSNYLAQLNQLEADYLLQKQNASQAMFNNIMQIAGLGQQATQFNKQFGLQARQMELQEQAQQFEQKQALNSVALEFGLEVGEGETMESIINRATPLVQEMRGLEKQRAELSLQQMRTSIAESNQRMAQVAQARADRKKLEGLTADDIIKREQLGLPIPEGFLDVMPTNERNAYFGEKISQKSNLVSSEMIAAKEAGEITSVEEAIDSFTYAYGAILPEEQIKAAAYELFEDSNESKNKSNVPLNVRFGNALVNTFGGSSSRDFGESFTNTFN